MDIIIKIIHNEGTPFVCRVQRMGETVFLQRRLTAEQRMQIASRYWNADKVDIEDKINKHVGPCTTCFDSLEQLKAELKLQYASARIVAATLNSKPIVIKM